MESRKMLLMNLVENGLWTQCGKGRCLSMTVSRPIHVVGNGIISFFLWLRSIPSCVCTAGALSVHLSTHI